MPPKLSCGSTGRAVLALQQTLNYRMKPTSRPLKLDGIFGPKTEAAVKEYQSLHHLEADGIVGNDTHGALATRLFLMKGTLYRQVPLATANTIAAEGASREAAGPTATQAQPAPNPPAPLIVTRVVQLQKGLTFVTPPWLFPPGQQPGTIVQKSLQLSLIYKAGDHAGHVEFGPFVQASANSQPSPSDPKVSFTGGYQFGFADLLAPWKLPLLKGWVFHPLALAHQTTIVFNAKPASYVVGMSIVEQSQLDLGSERFSVVLGGALSFGTDLRGHTSTLGGQATIGAVLQF